MEKQLKKIEEEKLTLEAKVKELQGMLNSQSSAHTSKERLDRESSDTEDASCTSSEVDLDDLFDTPLATFVKKPKPTEAADKADKLIKEIQCLTLPEPERPQYIRL